MILGVTAQNHDASMALINDQDILWAAHSERYSRIKNDRLLNPEMVNDLRRYGEPSRIIWFEKPILKNLRRLYSGQRPWYVNPKEELKRVGLDHLPLEYVSHHESHAAAGFYTSSFDTASVLVVDAIGELSSVSIWTANDRGLSKYWEKYYPNSIGLFYTAFTDYVGLKPNEEEYIFMGMAAYGQPTLVNQIKDDFFINFSPPNFKLKHNLHRGCRWWELPSNATKFDIAASVQVIIEEYLLHTTQWMKAKLPSNNLVFMGGAALNCVANSLIAKKSGYQKMWIMPNPGDSGSAIGAVAAKEQKRLNWINPLLGTNIDRELNLDKIINSLLKGEVVAVANGRAEFGPRALGNRSLLYDPRLRYAKSQMNSIKRREPFRPFAPAILEEHADQFFEMPVEKSPYMQYVMPCKTPSFLPGTCHIDGTSRLQTVGNIDNPTFRTILEMWYHKTGCPVLLNTSLNTKGEPLINDITDAISWELANNIRVY
jgi:carbamoyltransferase